MSAPEERPPQEPQQPIVDEEDQINPYDLLAETDGELPLVDEAMQKVLYAMLEEEANQLGGEDLTEIVADFREEPFDEEEFMSHIPYPNLIEGGYEDEAPTTATTPTQQPAKDSKQGLHQPKQQQPQQQKKPQQKSQQPSKGGDNEGWITVGKNGKPLKTKENRKAIQQQKKEQNGGGSTPQKKPHDQTSQNSAQNQPKSQQQKSQQLQQSQQSQTQQPQQQPQQQPKQSQNKEPAGQQQHFADIRAGIAEVRPKMPGNPAFPFCFACARRHDFGECDEP